jgi:hypothetical protein
MSRRPPRRVVPAEETAPMDKAAPRRHPPAGEKENVP